MLGECVLHFGGCCHLILLKDCARACALPRATSRPVSILPSPHIFLNFHFEMILDSHRSCKHSTAIGCTLSIHKKGYTWCTLHPASPRDSFPPNHRTKIKARRLPLVQYYQVSFIWILPDFTCTFFSFGESSMIFYDVYKFATKLLNLPY